MHTRLSILNRIGKYIQAAGEIDKILHGVLTAVVASYGLDFDRAALFFYDKKKMLLVGRKGFGNIRRVEVFWDSPVHFGNFRKQMPLRQLQVSWKSTLIVLYCNIHTDDN